MELLQIRRSGCCRCTLSMYSLRKSLGNKEHLQSSGAASAAGESLVYEGLDLGGYSLNHSRVIAGFSYRLGELLIGQLGRDLAPHLFEQDIFKLAPCHFKNQILLLLPIYI